MTTEELFELQKIQMELIEEQSKEILEGILSAHPDLFDINDVLDSFEETMPQSINDIINQTKENLK